MDRITRQIMQQAKRDGWTMTDLAVAAGISRQQLYRIRSGERTPSLETVQAMARAVGFKLTLVA